MQVSICGIKVRFVLLAATASIFYARPEIRLIL
jgi:hypothetical protein